MSMTQRTEGIPLTGVTTYLFLNFDEVREKKRQLVAMQKAGYDFAVVIDVLNEIQTQAVEHGVIAESDVTDVPKPDYDPGSVAALIRRQCGNVANVMEDRFEEMRSNERLFPVFNVCLASTEIGLPIFELFMFVEQGIGKRFPNLDSRDPRYDALCAGLIDAAIHEAEVIYYG